MNESNLTGRSSDELDAEALRELDAAVRHLSERYAQRDPQLAAALQHELGVLRGLVGGQATGQGVQGSLGRLRSMFDAAVAGGLYEESREASLLILLNRLLGV